MPWSVFLSGLDRCFDDDIMCFVLRKKLGLFSNFDFEWESSINFIKAKKRQRSLASWRVVDVNHLVSVKLVGKNSRETFEGQISTVKIDLKKEKTSV